ncbi:MAG: hypothetical protein MUO22_09095 [Sedimentisphaerales bacterium]|nr:hypothetical protein [Sedimentisphaerales bacterium]
MTAVEYLDDSQDIESFTMDDLGNRTSAVLRGERPQGGWQTEKNIGNLNYML